MRAKAEPSSLVRLMARHGIQPLLESTRAFIVLLDKEGKVLLGNPSFETFQKSLPNTTAFEDFLSSASRTNFNRLLQSTLRDRLVSQRQLSLGPESQRARYDCFLIPLPRGRVLIFAESLPIAPDLPEKYKRLTDDFAQQSLELQRAKLALENKQRELKAVIAQADEVSHTDALTFLPNRRQIIGDLQREVTRSDRYGSPLSISMVDIDHFKKINDTYGHTVGDEVLRNLASQLRDHIRYPDTIGRYGGEEFLIILPNSGLKSAVEQASRLCTHTRTTPVETGEQSLHVTIIIGIAQYRVGHENWQNFLSRADAALYQAKHKGRDQWVVAEE